MEKVGKCLFRLFQPATIFLSFQQNFSDHSLQVDVQVDTKIRI